MKRGGTSEPVPAFPVPAFPFESLKECSYEPLLSKIKERLNVE